MANQLPLPTILNLINTRTKILSGGVSVDATLNPGGIYSSETISGKNFPSINGLRIASSGLLSNTGDFWLTSKPKTASVSVGIGDILVVCGIGGDYGGAIDDFTDPTGGGLTYTIKQKVQITLNSFPWIWTAPSSSSQSFTLSLDIPGAAPRWGAFYVVVSGSSGVGNSAVGNGTGGASLPITTSQNNSMIIFGAGDWDAVSGDTTRVYLTQDGITPVRNASGELAYNRVAGEYTAYGALWNDVSTAGAKTVGWSAPSASVKYAAVAVEILPQTLASPQSTNANGIVSSETIGSPAITTTYTISANGITSDEQIGASTVTTTTTINANGITSSEIIGNNVVTTTVDVVVNSIVSTEVVGSPSIVIVTAVNANGITSNEQLGSPTITTTYSISTSGIVSDEKFGSTNAITAVSILAHGIISNEQLGTPTITTGSVTISANGIVSAEYVGNNNASSGVVTITTSGVVSEEKLGSPTVSAGTATITANSIVSSETLGSASVTTTYNINAKGITSLELFGSTQVGTASSLFGAGIETSERLGSPSVIAGAVVVVPGGVPSSEFFGVSITSLGVLPNNINASGITSYEFVGPPHVGKQVRIDVSMTIAESIIAIAVPDIIDVRLDADIVSEID